MSLLIVCFVCFRRLKNFCIFLCMFFLVLFCAILLYVAWQAYIGLLLVSFLLFWMGLGTFAMDIEESGDRLGYSITV